MSYLKEHQQTIAINEENYRTYLEKLEKLPSTKLSFCQDFLRQVRNKFERQIQVDLDYLAIGGDRLQHLIVRVQNTIAVEPVVRFGQEANPRNESMSFLAEDKKLLTCARSVARVSVPKIIDEHMKQEKVSTGTGWLITPELALTCWHVIEARGRWDEPIRELDLQEQIANGLLIFENALPGQGIEYKIKELEYYNPDLDYALLRLQDRDARPLQQWGFLRFDEDEPVTVQTKLLVIQHPKGQPQQRSEGYFVKNASDTNCILHNAPTEPGTSGAPVLKVNNWQVVALHNGESKAEPLREATPISAILSDLRQNQKELHSEIKEAQNS